MDNKKMVTHERTRTRAGSCSIVKRDVFDASK